MNKTYRSIVWLSKVITEEDVAFLNSCKNLVLSQKTPIRVLHRRSLATRKKTVLSLFARPISEHHMILSLLTQAGTYIKEFVHGDFGRTFPNLGSLLSCEADILQLDVINVGIDFPSANNSLTEVESSPVIFPNQGAIEPDDD